MKRKILRLQRPGAAGRAARERPSGGLFPLFHNGNAADRSAIPDREVAACSEAYRSPASLHAGFGFYRARAADEAFNAAHREPRDTPVLITGAQHSMGAGEAPFEAGLKALSARNVRVASIPSSGRWIAEEQPSTTAELIATFAASVR